MDQKLKEELSAQGRREKEHDQRMQSVEEVLTSFRESLRGLLKPEAAEEAVAAFNEVIGLVKGAAKARQAKLYEAVINYGKGSSVKLGPTTTRDGAVGLARSWMEGHAGVTSKGEPVRSVSIDVVEEGP